MLGHLLGDSLMLHVNEIEMQHLITHRKIKPDK